MTKGTYEEPVRHEILNRLLMLRKEMQEKGRRATQS